MKNFILILSLFIGCTFISCQKSDPSKHIIVITKYKAQPNRSVDAVTGLKKMIEEVKKEDHFVSLKLHIDQKDNSNILVYEEWDDELYYQNQHMSTDHRKDFIMASQTYLLGTPDFSTWKVNTVYE